MATHRDERPHKCKICTAAFKTKKALNVHKNVHEERKYECPVCLQRFLVNQAMRQHVAKRHPEFELPPPGTIMNKNALKRIEEFSSKYNAIANQSVVSETLEQSQGQQHENFHIHAKTSSVMYASGKLKRTLLTIQKSSDTATVGEQSVIQGLCKNQSEVNEPNLEVQYEVTYDCVKS